MIQEAVNDRFVIEIPEFDREAKKKINFVFSGEIDESDFAMEEVSYDVMHDIEVKI